MVGQQRRCGNQLSHIGIFAIQNAQRITFKATLTIRNELRIMTPEVLAEQVTVASARLSSAE